VFSTKLLAGQLEMSEIIIK